MTSTPTIGTNADGHDVVLDIDKLVGSRLLVQANSGAGKSWALRVILEQTFGHVPQHVIDLEGEFATLRELGDYILCGRGGDVALEVKTAKLLARRLLEHGANAILDISEMEAHERQAFVRTYLKALLDAPRKLWRPLLVVVDEARQFCLDEETEILGVDGWLRWSDLEPGVMVATFDTTSGRYLFEPVLRVITKQHSGGMVSLQSDGIDCICTPDHRVVLRRTQRGQGRRKLYDWTFCQASDVPQHVYVPIGGAPIGGGIDGLSEDMAELLGWIIADGSFMGSRGGDYRKYLSISQSWATHKAGESTSERLTALAQRLGAKSIYQRPDRVTAKRADGRVIQHQPSIEVYLGVDLSAECLRFLGQDIHRIPRVILREGSKAQLDALWRGLLFGDGTYSNGDWVQFYPGKNEALADDIQELSCRLGISATKSFVPSIGQWHIRMSERKRHYVRKVQTEENEGLVWDITVPSGAFVARRNGKVFVTGNCPEKGKAEAAAAVIDLMTRGRKRGFCGLLATQRLSKLNKDAAAEANNRLIGRTALDIDMARAADDLGMAGKDRRLTLRHLKPGAFFTYGPAFGVDGVELVTIGPVTTTHPRPGQDAIATAPPASTKIASLLAQEFADLPAEADEEANQVATLKRDLANARREVKRLEKQDGGVSQEELDQVHAEGYAAGRKAHDDEVGPKILDALAHVEEACDAATVAKDKLQALDRATDDGKAFAKASAPVTRKRTASPMRRQAPQPTADETLSVGGAKQRILDAIAFFMGLDGQDPARDQVALVAGYSVRGGAYSNQLSMLKTAGLIDYPASGKLTLTDSGRSHAVWNAALTTEDLHRELLAKVKPARAKLLQILIDAYPDSLSRQQLAADAGEAAGGGAFSNKLSALKTYGLIEYPAQGYARARDILFLEAS